MRRAIARLLCGRLLAEIEESRDDALDELRGEQAARLQLEQQLEEAQQTIGDLLIGRILENDEGDE